MKPELTVRQLAHSLGYRFRLHRKDLPGCPDLVFPSRRAVIFVHGCFWHQHPDHHCKLARQPKSRRHYWEPKLTRNATRDAAALAKLKDQGWRTMVIWECEIKDYSNLERRIKKFLRDGHSSKAITEVALTT